MPIILHCGPQKTGSTYLQSNLFAQREQLAARDVHYMLQMAPDAPANTKRSELGNWLRHCAAEELAALGRGIPRNKRVVISDEMLADLRPPRVKLLAECWPRRQVDAVFYFRRWSDRLPSYWVQRVKEGEGRSFAEWLAQTTADRMLRRWSDDWIWSAWRVLGGASRLRILSYDGIRAAGRDLYEDFLQTCLGVADAKVEMERPRNVSPPPVEVELIRAMAKLAQAQGTRFTLRNANARAWIKRKRKAGYEPFLAQMTPMRGSIVLDDAADQFAAEREAVASWRRHYVLPQGGDMLLPGRREVQVYDPRWAEAPEVSRLLEADLKTVLAPP